MNAKNKNEDADLLCGFTIEELNEIVDKLIASEEKIDPDENLWYNKVIKE